MHWEDEIENIKAKLWKISIIYQKQLIIKVEQIVAKEAIFPFATVMVFKSRLFQRCQKA